MRRLTRKIMCGILAVLLAGASVQAALQLVDNFDGMTGGNMPYNVATVGGGGIWSTNTGGTSGNIYVETNSGSTVIRFMTTTDGTNSRGFGFAGIDNTIEDTQKGLLFFRFSIRAEGNAADTYFGIHALSGDTPFSVAGNDPEDYIVAGFRAVNGAGTAVNLVKTKDAGAILLAGLTRGQWYNCWIDANNAANTFDLYISAAGGPAGTATLPTSADKVGSDLPFENTTAYGTSALMGAFFDTPRLSSTTRSTTQSARTYIDEVYWDGDEGLSTKKARNPVPGNGATFVPVNQILSWSAADDPNVLQSSVQYDVYMDPNQIKVATGSSSCAWKTGNQAGTTFDPTPDMAYNTQYFWRVDTRYRLNTSDPNTYVAQGNVWNFTTTPEMPVITAQPVNQVRGTANGKPDATLAVAAINATGYQWYKNDVIFTGGTGSNTATLTITGVALGDEGQYFCRVSSSGGVLFVDSNKVWLEYARQTSQWDFEDNYDNSIAGGPAIVPTSEPNTPTFAAGKVGTKAVSFDGLGDYATIPVAALPKAGTEMTYAFWATNNTPTVASSALYACKIATPTIRQLNIHIPWTSNVAYFDISNPDTGTATAYDRVGATPRAVTDPWIFWVFTKDIETGVMRAYQNGELLAQATGMTRRLYGPEEFFLGRGVLTSGLNTYFNGSIDNLKIYNYALDPVTVAYAYTDVNIGESVCVDRQDPILVTYDYNKNCKVDLGDLAMIASNWLYSQNVPGLPR